MSNDPVFLLEDAVGGSNALVAILTSTKRKEMKRIIRQLLWNWMQNKYFDDVRDKLVDVAVIVHTNKLRAKRQDLDNISKIVLDSIKKEKNSLELSFLINDDSQVIRLLLQKIEKTAIEGYETDQVAISFRIHDPTKQMVLVKLSEIGIKS